jgi:ribosome maturation protein Sdo1
VTASTESSSRKASHRHRREAQVGAGERRSRLRGVAMKTVSRQAMRRSALSWLSRNAVTQSRIARAMGEEAVSRAFLAVAEQCANENLADLRSAP